MSLLRFLSSFTESRVPGQEWLNIQVVDIPTPVSGMILILLKHVLMPVY